MSRRQLRDDEPGRRRDPDRVGPHRTRRTDRRTHGERRGASRSGSRGGARRQPDHAPSRPRHRPHTARASAVHTRDQSVGDGAGRGPRPAVAVRAVLPRAVHRRPRRSRHAAAILAEGPHRSAGMQLLVDIGTNAEIVLGNRERLFAASSPTGPAFEGAQTSSGQRATAGAIERVRIDADTLEPRHQGDRHRRPGRTSRDSTAASRRRASPGCAARASSMWSPRCSSPASSTTRGSSAPT